MKHHYIISHDTKSGEWQFEDELESEMFKLHTIYNPVSDEWHRSFIGDDEFFPNQERLTMILSKALDRMNKQKFGRLKKLVGGE